ncbi:uncharacterized protein ELE39_000821 [Cryptosporidium sp. chipmunk genotype I]|uniref:uncharacterized protein n=1 Tax=Cryptosporidium sp. chipmunk genotype I TaxID=1280935 RepID=UPI00351A6C64|nr:hypothetical protein ELE39_000821 [Cryptosporidium sp. chipmunk genotype I]
MKVRLILAFKLFLEILWLALASNLNTDLQKLDARNLWISDPELEQTYNFFTKTLSNSEKENLIKLNSSSEYARSTIPKGAGYDFTVQMAIYTLSESLYISPELFKVNITPDSISTKKDIFEIANCLHSTSRSTLKVLKLIRQRCFYHNENSQLHIFPKQVARKLELYCNEFKKIEVRYARLSDFIYLLKMILKKSKIHNSNLFKLSKLVWNIIKSSSFKNIKFSKDLSAPISSPKPDIKLSKKEAATISKISVLLRHIDNTLLEKVRILPFWIFKASDEYSAILIETESITERIWPPMKERVALDLKKLKKCTYLKKASCCSRRSSKVKLSKNEKFIQNVQAVAKQIRSSIE